MMNIPNFDELAESLAAHPPQSTRRKFLQYTGLAAGMAAVATATSGCVGLFRTPQTSGHGSGIDLGRGDTGIMNYAYALESLEAEYYTIVMQRPYAGMSRYEHWVLTDIRDHELVHREFFKRALGANAIPKLQFDFSSVDFGSRTSVLTTAMNLEDLGVTAYNGAGQLLRDPRVLTIAGKIVSVEARHAQVLRDIIAPGTQYAENGLDGLRSPAIILSRADRYIASKVSGRNLPRI